MNQNSNAPAHEKRFSLAEDGSINVKANISHSELADLPKHIADFSGEAFVQPFSPHAKECYKSILDAMSQFLPDEFEQQHIYDQMREKERQ